MIGTACFAPKGFEDRPESERWFVYFEGPGSGRAERWFVYWEGWSRTVVCVLRDYLNRRGTASPQRFRGIPLLVATPVSRRQEKRKAPICNNLGSFPDTKHRAKGHWGPVALAGV